VLAFFGAFFHVTLDALKYRILHCLNPNGIVSKIFGY